ncbi:hypothetical protein [Sphingomonas jatrophae]|uniref:Uncharacterized protein n=1 Tax=Sphingomonas jatrophae TaxID=1166337 RepID=A0A1I6K651_9SPHN|nr:hypothetical protein [Sphingomonas jatrophae]SFR86721.1 hypothetical protein SAMN05192580_1370 [Sphingomonas jatrophae]
MRMRTGLSVAAGLLLLSGVLLGHAAHGQSTFPTVATRVRAPGVVPLTCRDGRDCQPIAAQEVLVLVSANAATAAQTAFGGDYIFAQVCTAYGTVALQVQGPDGGFQTISSKAASDTAGGTQVRLGASASVRVQLSGTIGCAATLSRVPN